MGEAARDTTEKLVVQIVSKENILPTSPTPEPLKTYKLSVLDQTQLDLYVPLILFYSNNYTTDIKSGRSRLLKDALSQTLTRFYPLAGKVIDELHIDCNDEGAYYIETQVNTCLSDFLNQPLEDDFIKNLVPNEASESPVGNYALIIQVNIFTCGGIALCTCLNHKFMDGYTYTLFLKDWTAASRGCSSEIVDPSYIAPMLFPQIPSLSFERPLSISKTKVVSQRFVFNSLNLAALKAKTKILSSGYEPTRFEAVAALLWRCVAKAACKLNESAIGKPFNLGLIVNLRGKNCVPKHAVGNLVWPTLAECNLAPDLEHNLLVDQIKKCKAEINDDFVEIIKGDKGTPTITKIAQLMSAKEVSFSLWITSMCNMGVYEHDFGWGKPAWFYYCGLNLSSFVSLCDTAGASGGIEAVVSLSEQEMAIVEKDPELLAYASINTAPL